MNSPPYSAGPSVSPVEASVSSRLYPPNLPHLPSQPFMLGHSGLHSSAQSCCPNTPGPWHSPSSMIGWVPCLFIFYVFSKSLKYFYLLHAHSLTFTFWGDDLPFYVTEIKGNKFIPLSASTMSLTFLFLPFISILRGLASLQPCSFNHLLSP